MFPQLYFPTPYFPELYFSEPLPVPFRVVYLDAIFDPSISLQGIFDQVVSMDGG